MSINLENVTAVENLDGRESVLGHLMWYSIGKQLVKAEQLEIALANSLLDKSYLPNPIRSSDAFRRATKEIETRRATSNPNVFENYLIREVYSDKETIQRNIVVETVDQSGKRLAYDSNAAIITLDKKTDAITATSHTEVAKELCEVVQGQFSIYKEHYSAQQVRVMVGKILNNLAPTPVRPNGGVYFVPSSHTEGLDKLITFATSLEKSEGFKVPVVNTLENVKMVTTKFDDHLESLLAECQSSPQLRKSQIQELVKNANNVIGDFQNYRQITDTGTNDLESKIMFLKAEIHKVIDNMD